MFYCYSSFLPSPQPSTDCIPLGSESLFTRSTSGLQGQLWGALLLCEFISTLQYFCISLLSDPAALEDRSCSSSLNESRALYNAVCIIPALQSPVKR